MKRILTLILSLVMTLSLFTACGGKTETPAQTTGIDHLRGVFTHITKEAGK